MKHSGLSKKRAIHHTKHQHQKLQVNHPSHPLLESQHLYFSREEKSSPHLLETYSGIPTIIFNRILEISL